MSSGYDPNKEARRRQRRERIESEQRKDAWFREIDRKLDENDAGPNGDYPGWGGTRSFPQPDPVLDAWYERYRVPRGAGDDACERESS